MHRLLRELPSRLTLTKIWRMIHTSSIPILLLHGVLPDADTSPFNSTGKFISPDKLRIFLSRISRTYRVISMDHFVDSVRQERELSNVMVVTFDDGYANTYVYGMPLLSEMGLPFSVFVTTGLIDTREVLWTDMLEFALLTTRESILPGSVLSKDVSLARREDRMAAIAALKQVLKTKCLEEAQKKTESICERLKVDQASPEFDKVRFLTTGQIREMSDQGIEFGGHTVTHPILSRESIDRVRAEVVGCKRHLEEITGKPVRHFAYPNGRREDFNEAVKREVKQAGYGCSLTSIHGLHRPGDDIFEIRRVSVLNHWAYEEFETRASGILKAVRRQ